MAVIEIVTGVKIENGKLVTETQLCNVNEDGTLKVVDWDQSICPRCKKLTARKFTESIMSSQKFNDAIKELNKNFKATPPVEL